MSLGEISEKIHYGYTASAKETGNVKLLRITDIQNGVVNWSSVPFCYATGKEIEKFKLNYGDIVIARTGGTIGKSYLIAKKTKEIAVFASYLIRVKPKLTYVNPSYLFNFFDSPFYWTQLFDGSRGTGQPNVNAHALSKIKVPLPSIEEQCRIVTRVNKLFDQIDYAERAYNELSGPLSERLRQLCLEKAIQGKLVPQLESEPDGIQLGDVPNRCPFNIPTKWRWVYFSNVVECLDRKRVPVKKANRDRMKKIFDYYGATGVIDRVENYIFEERLLLIGEDGANLLSKARDNAFFATGKYWVNNHAHVFRGTKNCLLDYLAIYINAISLAPYVTGSAQPKLTLKNLSSIPVPLPPIEEQQRIVHQVSSLLLIINDLSMINK